MERLDRIADAYSYMRKNGLHQILNVSVEERAGGLTLVLDIWNEEDYKSR